MNRMEKEPINKLLLTTGLPIIISMMMQAAYNIVDSIFVGNISQVGELALNALTLAFPIQMLIVAFGVGTGVGMNALISRSLGEGHKEYASRVASNAIILSFIIYLVVVIFGLFGVNIYVHSQTTNPQVITMANNYIRICSLLSIGLLVFNILEKLLQSTGLSKYSTIAQLSGAITNIILDPLFIFTFHQGVIGAAIATVIGQFVSCLLGFYFHIKYNKEIENKKEYYKVDLDIIKKIYEIGLPAIIAQALTSFMTYGLNIILVTISENAVTAYGLFYKIQQFILFASFGLRDALTPIISYNYGIGSKKRVNEGIKYGMIYTLIIMGIGLVIVQLTAPLLSGLFGLSGTTQTMFLSAMRIISLSFLFAGANIAFQGIFQALQGGKESLIISLLRQLVLILPLVYLFSLTHNMILVWFSFFITEGITCLVGMKFMKNIRNKTVNNLN